MASTTPSTPGSAVGFPGQGGDWKAAVRTLRAHPGHEAVAAVADRLGTDRWDELDERDTRVAQPVIVASGLAAAAEAMPAGSFVATIGHSLGEITAAAHAGALSATEAVDLAVLRAALGHRQHEDRPGAMIAVIRLGTDEVEWLRRGVLADHAGVLEVAVANSPTQFVLSGDAALVDVASERAEGAGAVVRRLPIGGSFHSPLMAPAVEDLRAAASERLVAPAVPVVLSTWPEAVSDPVVLADRLARSLVLPVRWADATAVLPGIGATELVDAGPGDTLVRLGRFLPGTPTRAIGSP
jgi:[acyl-carrier-protein] S-malonyltransferase